MDMRIPNWNGPGLWTLDEVEYQVLLSLGLDPSHMGSGIEAARQLRTDISTLHELALSYGLPRFKVHGRIQFQIELAKIWLAYHPRIGTAACVSPLLRSSQGRLS